MLGEKLADQELPDRPARARQRQGGGAALRPLRRRRLGARPGDEEHRRGDGHRRRLPDRLRQGAGGGRGARCPTEGAVFITVTDTDKPAATQIAARFHDLGFEVIATGGTAQAISRDGGAGDADQQDRRGLAARRRPDPRAPLRPGDQHADRLRRPRRRLRDPHRRRPPRHPLRDDDDRRHRRRARDRRRRSRATPRSARLQEIHGAAAGPQQAR